MAHSIDGAFKQGHRSHAAELLVVFAYLLTLVETDGAGRAFAAHGGIYIGASLTWLWLVEGIRPGRWDIVGAAICIVRGGPPLRTRPVPG